MIYDYREVDSPAALPTPDTDGNVCFMAPAANLLGYDWCLCKHEELTYIDTKPEKA